MDNLKEYIYQLLTLKHAIPMIAFVLALASTLAYVKSQEWNDVILMAGITLIAFSWAFP
jgi:hypothetical protein